MRRKEKKGDWILSNDEQQLNLLGTLHYVFAGLCTLGACVFIVHLVIGLMVLINPESMQSKGDMPPEAMGWMFTVMGGAGLLGGWTLAALVLFAGRALKRRVRHVYCMVIAALCCLMFPLGTALGIFSLVVLARAPVKELFISGEAARKQSAMS